MSDLPVDQWISHPVFDSSDYLDGDPPTYDSDEPDPEPADRPSRDAPWSLTVRPPYHPLRKP